MPCPERLKPSRRSFTWPTTHAAADGTKLHKPKSAPETMPSVHKKPRHDPFEDELDDHPEDHYLSPVRMHEYEDWADNSDDDADEVEWDAGITDFALFDNDRRQAQARHEHVPDRWGGLLSSQASALQRAVERNRAVSDPKRKSWTPLLEDVPQLTPDNSPNLRDEFDIHSYCGQNAPRPSIPNYLRFKVTPPMEDDSEDDDDDEDSDDDDLPISFLVERARERQRQARKMERPGLRFNRTMSGNFHVWRRPSYHIYPVGEDVEAERRAELVQTQQSVDERGRQRQ